MNGRYYVGEWLVEPDQNRLVRRGDSARVDTKALGVLTYLAEHPNELLTKEQIISAVWEGAFVSDEVLTTAVWSLRKALGDDPREPRYIKTVPRQGYRLLAPVRDASEEKPVDPLGRGHDHEAQEPALEKATPEEPLEGEGQTRARTEREGSRRKWRRGLAWTMAAAVILTALIVLENRRAELPSGPGPVGRLDVDLSTEALQDRVGSALALSPDGQRLAYAVGRNASAWKIQLRFLDRIEAAPLGGTEGGYQPFFSPDGKWVGFVTANRLKKVPVSGGAVLDLAEVDRARGESWAPDGTIIFAATPESGLSRLPADGGESGPLTRLAEGEASHRWPQVLPGGQAVLFTSNRSLTGFDEANIEVVGLATGERKLLHRGGYYARYVPSGHILYAREGSLYAAPFDLRRLEVTGAPQKVLDDVLCDPSHGHAHLTVSGNGLLVYRRRESGGWAQPNSLLWSDRDGKMTPLVPERKVFAEPHLSPDGSRLAVQIHQPNGENPDIWVYDLERGSPTRITFEESTDVAPIWSPDGKSIAFGSDRNGTLNLYWTRADGSGEVERLTQSENLQAPSSFSPDGKYLLYYELTKDDFWDLFALPLDRDRRPRLFLKTPFKESEAAFSPDGRWVSYHSNETGQYEIYVRPFPPAEGKWMVSTSGGRNPRWSRQGRELFYRDDDSLMVVSYRINGKAFVPDRPRKLLEGRFRILWITGFRGADYDVAPDGEHFVIIEQDEPQQNRVAVIFNWFEELERLVPTAE